VGRGWTATDCGTTSAGFSLSIRYGTTGTSWTYLEADEIAESGLGRLNNHLRIRIRTFGASRTHVAIREIEWEFDRV